VVFSPPAHPRVTLTVGWLIVNDIESDKTMWKKIKVTALLVGLCLLSFYTSTRVLAEPSPPTDVVNHTTKECAQILTGDECESCAPAEGWELLKGSCPEGYTVLAQWAPSTCTFYASPYCCESRAKAGAGCTSLPSFTKYISIGSVLVFTTIIGVVLVVLYKKRVGQN
jgi:hypothetical protein